MGMQGVLSREDHLAELAKPAAASTSLTSIVVAVDRTSAARNAVACGAALAAQFGARLYLVHAVETLAHCPPSAVMGEMGVAEIFDFARERLDDEKKALRVPSPHAAIEAVRLGHAAREVAVFAKAKSAELIITGTRSEPGRHRLQEESVAGELIKLAAVPVLVVHGKPLPERAPGSRVFERPLAAIDYSESSRAALQAAALLGHGACVDAVHVATYGEIPDALDLGSLNARARAVEAESRVLGEWLPRALPGPNRCWHAHVSAGRLPTSIVDFAVGGGYDLVACGTHGRPSAPLALVGSVAEALLDALECPVLVLREAQRGERALEEEKAS